MKPNGRPFTWRDAVAMFDEMVLWLAEHQVAGGHPHEGAVYFPTEDRFCNRDTACMARAFMRQHARTGDPAWRGKAASAREYVLSVQKPHGGFPELRGRAQSDDGSTVNTALIAANLVKAYELGLDCGPRDLEALARMADFELTLEWRPGAFYHDLNHLRAFVEDPATGKLAWGDEGSHRDCQNTTALAAMMLPRIHAFLASRDGRPKAAWLDAAARARRHLLEGQDSEGQWPYYTGASWKDAGHHAMCLHYLAEAACASGAEKDRAVLTALRRGGRWLAEVPLLQTRRGTKIDWAVSSSACLYFTTEYFFIAAAFAWLAAVDTRAGARWRQEAIELLRYVRNALWDNENRREEGPYRLTEAGIKLGYAWFGQSMGWCLYTLDEVIAQCGWWPRGRTGRRVTA